MSNCFKIKSTIQTRRRPLSFNDVFMIYWRIKFCKIPFFILKNGNIKRKLSLIKQIQFYPLSNGYLTEFLIFYSLNISQHKRTQTNRTKRKYHFSGFLPFTFPYFFSVSGVLLKITKKTQK